MTNRDMKNYRANESEAVHLTRLSTYLIFTVFVAVIGWIQDRDSHPFNNVENVNHAQKRAGN